MISNADNLGATFRPAHRRAHGAEGDSVPDGGSGWHRGRSQGRAHRATEADGQLVLRETAQTPPEDEESFRDFRRWRFYNTNNLWVDLRALTDKLDETGGVLELPLIVNRKTVDPRDRTRRR